MKAGKLISSDNLSLVGLAKCMLTLGLAGHDDIEVTVKCPECDSIFTKSVNKRKTFVKCKYCHTNFKWR